MDARELLKWMRTAAELWIKTGNTDENPVEDILIKQGYDRDLAWIIMECLPAAMAETVVDQMDCVRIPTYVRPLTDGTRAECHWKDDAVYQAACLFRDAEAFGRWDEFKRIAQCSPDLDAMNQALMAGEDVEGSQCAIAPFHAIPPDSPWLPANAVFSPSVEE